MSLAAANAIGSDTVVKEGYINVTGEGPVADFTGTPTSGESELSVQFTDTSTGNPTSWNWSFGDGEYSEEQSPSHAFIIADSYDVSLTAENENGTSTETKQNYISVTCPSYVSCDVTLTDPPYIHFGIDNVTFPGDSGVWRLANCYDNALIRWAMAGESSSFSTTLSPWMWKRNPCCQNPGYSYAVDAPANKPIYIAAVTNPDAAVYYHHHAVDAEYLGIDDMRYSEWGDWKFFNYHELNIQPGWEKQIPNGTSSFWTEIAIGRVDELPNVGQYRGDTMRTFYIAPNSTAYLHPREYYTESLVKSQVENPDLIKQKVSDEINNEIRTMKRDSPFTINNWEFDSTKKELIVYVHDIKDKNTFDKLDGRFNSNYSVRIVHDTEFEEIREDVEQQLVDLRQNLKYQIAWIGTVTDTNGDVLKKSIDLWVYKSTPENEKIDNTVIQGWTIHVHPISR